MSPLDEQLALLPSRLGPHLWLVLLSLTAGVAISLPLALLAVRLAALRWTVLTFAGVAQTIPSLALLALMVPLLDVARRALGASFPAFGFLPAALALVLYSLLPILRNTVTGLRGVDPAVLEAATGVGLSPRQVLLQVQLPLALPFILAGIRTSAVWTVGTATLSTPVGQTSLGNYIFSGLQTRNWTAVLVGCVATAAFALVLDAALGRLELAATERRRGPLVVGLTMVLAIVALALALRPSTTRGAHAGVVRIGAKTFTEQYVLAQALATSLNAHGFETTTLEGLGSNMLFDALAQGDLDVAVDYSGTLWANVLHREDVASREAVLTEVGRWLDEKRSISSLGSLGFENTYAFALPKARAQALGLTSLDALAGPIREMRVGSDYEFFSRPEWKRVAAVYDLKPREQVSSDPSLMYAAIKAGEVDLITTYSTDGRLDAFGLTVLEDPKHAFPPYDAMLLVSPSARKNPRLVQALRSWIGAVSVEKMRHANQLVDVEGQSKQQAATWLVDSIDAGSP
jgi:osmoprotectant transport system permease protein